MCFLKNLFLRSSNTKAFERRRTRPAGIEPALAAPEAAALSVRPRAQILNQVVQKTIGESISNIDSLSSILFFPHLIHSLCTTKPMRQQKITISVIGGHDINSNVEQIAHDIGKFIAKMDCVLVCGGLSGVMEHACKGAREEDGLTIGLLPGKDKNDANPFISIALPTSFGFARNAMVACSANIIVALPGSYGTESEICYGLVFGRPVVDLGNWKIPGMIKVKDLKDAKAKLKKMIERIKSENAGAAGSRND